MKVLILTKSDKNGGLCVAGLDVENGSFVRLVSNDVDSHYAIPHWCMSNVNVLDVIEVMVICKVPSFCQQENIKVQLQQWQKIGGISINNLQDLTNNSEPFIFGDECFYLEEANAQKMPYSLMMVQVPDLYLSCNKYGKTKASFHYNRMFYSNMSITDSDYYDVEGEIGDAILVISIPDEGHLSEYYEEKRCYKFISKIYEI